MHLFYFFIKKFTCILIGMVRTIYLNRLMHSKLRFKVIDIDKDDNITNEEYHIIETYRNLSDDLKLAINRILQIDM